ncbi:MAG: T9SS type A sorting domain-containing protein, partial [Bacteroidia bacterium]|nr:T9SS type A sorting domain-containing protein [Bacteroidia bacterium]
GGTGLYTYTWLSSTTSATSGFTAAVGTNNTINYSPGVLTQTTWFRRFVVSGAASDTSAAVMITVNTPGTWTGAVSNAWSTITNWSCPQIPTSTTNVTIPSGAVNMPLVNDARSVNNLTLQLGATLTVSGIAARLNIFGIVTNNGTINNTTGVIGFYGSTAQLISGGTYAKIEVNNASGLTLAGNITVNDSIILNNGIVSLQNNVLTLGNNGYASSGNATSYIRNNGTGNVVVNNVGIGGKTGNVIVPIGNSTYNPVVINNLGVADDYTMWVIDSVTNNYTGSVPQGAAITSNVVIRTWIINEAVAGGSNATITLQWNGAQEGIGFARNSAYISRYDGTTWNSVAAGSATGTNPYTLSRAGITSFSPFGIGSSGVLPVELLVFKAEKTGKHAQISWITTSEKNSDYFVVERSFDGVNFSSVETVKAAGNSNVQKQYSILDFNVVALRKALYYRLKQVDFDGKFEYSTIVLLSVANEPLVLTSVTPNPFESNLVTKVYATNIYKAEIIITDAFGKIIKQLTHDCEIGENIINLDNLEILSAGMYFITIKVGDKSFVHKVIHQ